MILPETVHASAVLIGETGVLVRGASGSGKSSLAISLIEIDPAAALLVADDRVMLTPANGRLLADVPPALAGLVELRGRGILRLPHIAPVLLRLVVDLVPAGDLPRLPDRDESCVAISGIALPRLFLPAGRSASPAAVRVAIRSLFGSLA